ncbi:NHL repeat-containing protein [candidate division KSB1 bacterium]
MSQTGKKNDRLLTRAVIVISVAGITYFGYQAISYNLNNNGKNPFEYNIEYFKKNDAELLHYSEIRQIPLDLKDLYGIAVGFEDDIYVTGEKSVLIINSEGKLKSNISISEAAYCIALDANGDLFLGIDDHIEVLDKDGNMKSRWKPPDDDAIITSIAISEEYVFVADAGNHIIWKYDKNGNVSLRIGDANEDKDIPGFINPSPFFDVSIDPDGFLWAANTGRHSVENYTFEGDFRTSWGEFSMGIKDFCGCCNPTHFVVSDEGKFITSEKGIARIKVYNRSGNLESVVAGPDQFNEGTEGLDLAIDSKGLIYVIDPMRKAVRIFGKNRIGK